MEFCPINDEHCISWYVWPSPIDTDINYKLMFQLKFYMHTWKCRSRIYVAFFTCTCKPILTFALFDHHVRWSPQIKPLWQLEPLRIEEFKIVLKWNYKLLCMGILYFSCNCDIRTDFIPNWHNSASYDDDVRRSGQIQGFNGLCHANHEEWRLHVDDEGCW